MLVVVVYPLNDVSCFLFVALEEATDGGWPWLHFHPVVEGARLSMRGTVGYYCMAVIERALGISMLGGLFPGFEIVWK